MTRPHRLLTLVGLLLVGSVAFLLGRFTHRSEAPPPASTAKASDSPEGRTRYTCGMHPQVIQEEPGNCSICGMKLTPMRREPGGGTGRGTQASGEREILHWRAPMDPTYISDKPGKSPIGMDLVPVYVDEIADSKAIAIDPVTIQNMALRTTVITNGPLTRTIRTVAAIEPDETLQADVTTKFMGWVEKLHVDSTGERVHRNDPLFEVYSPDLYSAQIEYLLALKSAGTAPKQSVDLLETAATKLSYWDISDGQIEELKRTRKPQKTLRILAPIDGFVLTKSVVEGQMVRPGEPLYRIADLGLVWVQAQIYEQDLPFISLGQEALVTLSYLPDRQFRGRVTYIYPDVDPKTRTVQVRMEFHNPGYFLKPGMFASVELKSVISNSALLVPDMAVLRSGDRNTVFVTLPEGRFAPRHVRLGARAENDMVQVLAGLLPGERVVTSGQFLLDSESQLREAVQKMLEPNQAKTAAHDAARPVATPGHPGPADGPESAANRYICPMPEHVSIEYDHPGTCPICDMNLVPVSSALLKQINPGGTVQHYTCPMPEHSDVKLDTPGKCPRCGMTLIPVMQPPPPSPSGGATPRTGDDSTTIAPSTDTPSLPPLYTCPMAVCQVVSDQPGRCPECEMELVSHKTVQHAAEMEALWQQRNPNVSNTDTEHPQPLPTLYTCPMKSHAHIVSETPGTCPECEMKLVETGTVDHQATAEQNWRRRHSTMPGPQH
jgi:Cu(I)/Ag(I) efflux system membrane fusion protein/cobalt-zinc-cadmium efflux system membrane fusion protein